MPDLDAVTGNLAQRLRPLLARFVSPAPEEGAKVRLVSVDVLRAVAIGGMLLVNNHASGGEPPLWVQHVDWEGLRFADVVFPWFLFVAGVSMALSFDKRADQSRLLFWAHFAARVLGLLVIGLVLNHYSHRAVLRIPGVLQRIALASALAAPFVRRKLPWVLLAATAFLAVHTAILLSAQPPASIAAVATRPFEAVAYWIDVRAFGAEHLYRGGFDPEGLLGVLSSAGQVLLGVATGRVLTDHHREYRWIGGLAAAGFAAVVAGAAIDVRLPIVKKLWTAPFVLVTSGMAAMLLVALYLLSDWLAGERFVSWAAPLGRNALAVYAGSVALAIWLKSVPAGELLGKEMSAYGTLSTAFILPFGPVIGALAYSFAHVVLWYAVASAMDRARLYIKL